MKNKTIGLNFSTFAMRNALEIFLITALVSSCLYSCNRSKFGGGDDETPRSKGVDIKIKKISNASATAKGKGQIQVSAAYTLLVNCDNCATLGIPLSFESAPMENNKHVYTADFDYSLATRTVVCALNISAVSQDSNAVSKLKTYKVYACPRRGATEICDTTDAVPSCAHITRR